MNYPICVVNPDGQKVTLQLLVNNALLAAGGFIIYDKNGKELNRWALRSDANGSASHTIDFLPDILISNYLKWAINVSSGSTNIDCGIVEIKIFQGNIPCRISNRLIYNLENIPPASTGEAVRIDSGVVFSLNGFDEKDEG